MPRIRTADARADRGPAGVTVTGRHAPLSRTAIIRAATTVLRCERRVAALSLTFVGPERMRELNARWKRRPEPTDVLAFSLAGPGGALLGDVYICPAEAALEAEARGLPLRQELLRLVIHGVLHVLGYDHPRERRTASAMWRRQERYLKELR
jgi:probable rRNA maturation factor